jgi:hypothetical protein
MNAGSDRFGRQMLEIERLIAELESQPGSVVIEQTRALVQAVLEVHAIGLGAILERLRVVAAGTALHHELAGDPQVAALLSLHGLESALDASKSPETHLLAMGSATPLVPVERLLKLAGGRER